MSFEDMCEAYCCIDPCYKCNTDVLWEESSHNKYIKCPNCNNRFPCVKKECNHFDCDDARKLYKQ